MRSRPAMFSIPHPGSGSVSMGLSVAPMGGGAGRMRLPAGVLWELVPGCPPDLAKAGADRQRGSRRAPRGPYGGSWVPPWWLGCPDTGHSLLSASVPGPEQSSRASWHLVTLSHLWCWIPPWGCPSCTPRSQLMGVEAGPRDVWPLHCAAPCSPFPWGPWPVLPVGVLGSWCQARDVLQQAEPHLASLTSAARGGPTPPPAPDPAVPFDLQHPLPRTGIVGHD